jgi:hypothetical protein
VTASEKVKVKVTVSSVMLTVPASLSVIVTVGAIVSTVRVTMLLVSAPSLLVLPATSEKVAETTEITPLAVLSAVGVKIAVYAVPEPAKLERVPPVALMSAEVKSVEASERVKVSVAVSPALRVLTISE